MRTVSDARGGALVVGSTGLIGRALMRALPAMFQPVWGTVRGTAVAGQIHLDLARPGLAEPVREAFAEIARTVRCAFLCGAISRFEDCAADPELSYRVNVTHSLELADFLLERGVTIIHLSSNAVFDGARAECEENAVPNPATEYGKQKAAAEAGLQKSVAQHNDRGHDVKIVRLTKVLSAELPLISSWIHSLRAGQRIAAFSDLIFAPVSLRYVTDALLGLGAAGKPGVYHLSGSADISYFDFASTLAQRLSVGQDFVSAGHAADWPGAAVLPRHSALGMAATTRETGLAPQTLNEVIEDILKETAHVE